MHEKQQQLVSSGDHNVATGSHIWQQLHYARAVMTAGHDRLHVACLHACLHMFFATLLTSSLLEFGCNHLRPRRMETGLLGLRIPLMANSPRTFVTTVESGSMTRGPLRLPRLLWAAVWTDRIAAAWAAAFCSSTRSLCACSKQVPYCKS